MSPVRAPRPGSRLRLRLVVRLVLVVGAACLLMAWASHQLIRDALHEQLVADLDARAGAVTRALEGLGRQTLAASGTLVDDQRRDDPEGIARLLGGGAGAAREAAVWAARSGLRWIEILDEDGVVVSSADWPEQAGLLHRELLELPADRVVSREIALSDRSAPALVVRRELPVGRRLLHVIVGTPLDAEALTRFGGEEAWLRIRPADGEAYVVGSPPVDPVAAWRSVGALPEGRAAVGRGEQSGWLLSRRAVTLGRAEGGLDIELITALSRAATARRLERLRYSLAVAAALAAVLAAVAGLWIARRVTAPVAELVRSVDAIAAGTQDYSFTRATRDEFEALETAFSRLQRSLDLQRERSRAAERVAAWRDVARRVAHEVKNPLAPIRLTVENLVRARARSGPAFDEMFDDGAATILEEVDRLRRLVSEFSEFARLPLPEPRPTDLARLIDDVVGLYGTEPDLTIELRHAPDLPPVPLDADQITRALSNVVGNAIEAMRELPPDRPRTLSVESTVDGAMVRVDVADRGPGLAADALDKLFEPYFTTKAGGTGLGLSITYRIVTEHGGVLVARNREGGGVRMTIRLPLDGSGFVASPDPVLPSGTGHQAGP